MTIKTITVDDAALRSMLSSRSSLTACKTQGSNFPRLSKGELEAAIYAPQARRKLASQPDLYV